MNLDLKYYVRAAVLALVASGIAMNSFPAPAFGQKTEDASEEDTLAAAHEMLTGILDKTDNLFYKAKVDENGNKFYTLVWDSNGESTKMILSLKELGHYSGKKVHSLSLWCYVYESETPVAPAVIKAVASGNDTLAVGSYSCSADFTKVYANMTGVLEGTGPGALWMYCAYLHGNRAKLAEQVKKDMAGAGK